jgi:hypothetical protein
MPRVEQPRVDAPRQQPQMRQEQNRSGNWGDGSGRSQGSNQDSNGGNRNWGDGLGRSQGGNQDSNGGSRNWGDGLGHSQGSDQGSGSPSQTSVDGSGRSQGGTRDSGGGSPASSTNTQGATSDPGTNSDTVSSSTASNGNRTSNVRNDNISETPATMQQLLGVGSLTPTSPASGPSKAASRLGMTRPPAPPRPDAFYERGAFKPHELLATDLNNAAKAHAKALGFTSAPLTLASLLGLGTVERLQVPPNLSEQQASDILTKDSPKSIIGPNYIFHIVPAGMVGDAQSKATDQPVAKAPNAIDQSCSGDHCFGRRLIGWKSDHSACARRVKIGIIDTSFDLAHPAFAGRTFRQPEVIAGGTPSANDWHGTAVLALLAGDSRSSTPGLVPEADFYLASVFKPGPDGTPSSDTASVLQALGSHRKNGVRIINMSFSGPKDDLIEDAIAKMSASGIIFVAAAGNHGKDAAPSYPAAYPQVIAVTAINQSMKTYMHANSGSYINAAAPGVDIWTALPGGKEGYRTGTSFAAPFVTGILATMPVARAGVLSKNELLARIEFKSLGAPEDYGNGLARAPAQCSAPPALVAARSNFFKGPAPAAKASAPAQPVSANGAARPAGTAATPAAYVVKPATADSTAHPAGGPPQH